MKIRRRGRHKAPSQVEKVAAQAGKAAPAMAIAGALVAVPHAQAASAAVKPAPAATTAPRQAVSTARITARVTLDSVTARSAPAHRAASTAPKRSSDYTVKSGDTLSKIAQTYYHKAADWQWLYHENDKSISNPNMIYPGQTLVVPADPPANYTMTTAYVPRHAKPATTAPAAKTSSSSGDSDGDSGATGGSIVTQSASEGTASSAPTTRTATASDGSSGNSSTSGSSGTSSSSGSGSTTLSGTLGCTGLEQLWKQAGGNPADAFMAAEIAMAESGGNQYALSPTNDYGYWQINASNGALATYNAYGNARAAITLSGNGTNWSPWTTYTSGAYAGRC